MIARWQKLRKFQLQEHPLCKFCLERGRVTAANVVDHVVPHRGDWTVFCTGELQSLCKGCHDATKRQIELHGYCTDIGLDGFPTDPNHPFNRAGWNMRRRMIRWPSAHFALCVSQDRCAITTLFHAAAPAGANWMSEAEEPSRPVTAFAARAFAQEIRRMMLMR